MDGHNRFERIKEWMRRRIQGPIGIVVSRESAVKNRSDDSEKTEARRMDQLNVSFFIHHLK